MAPRTILMGGFSKAYAMTGWRIGYVAAPKEYVDAMVRIHQYTIMSAPTISQYAALEALRIGEPYVQEMLAEYDRRRQLVCRRSNEMGLKTSVPHGALRLPGCSREWMDDEEFAEKRTRSAWLWCSSAHLAMRLASGLCAALTPPTITV